MWLRRRCRRLLFTARRLGPPPQPKPHQHNTAAETAGNTAATIAAHAPTEAAEEAAGHAVLRSRHGRYVELPPLPGQPPQSRRVVVPLPTFAMRAGEEGGRAGRVSGAVVVSLPLAV